MKNLYNLFIINLLTLSSFAQSIVLTPGSAGNMQAPKLSYEQILNIPSPKKGMMAYDSTFDNLRIYNGKKWLAPPFIDDQPSAQLTAWKAGGANVELGSDVATDNDGNVYITGSFVGTMVFGATNLVSAGGYDVFTAKYNKSGVLQWAKKGSNSDYASSSSIATDADGNAYVIGRFDSNISFGLVSISSAGNTDIFCVKYNSAGVEQWAKAYGGSNFEGANDIFIDGIYLYFCGNFDISTTIGTTNLTTNGSYDVFFAKATTANGTIQFAKQIGGSGEDYANGIYELFDEIYVIGNFTNIINIGGNILNSTGESDVFVAKYLVSGSTFDWAFKFGGTGFDEGTCISGKDYAIYFGGIFAEEVSYNSTILKSNGGFDIFLAKASTSGTKIWAKNAGGEGTDKIENIYLDSQENIYFAGIFSDAAQFDYLTIKGISAPPDGYVAKYASNGGMLWTKKFGGTGYENVGGVAVSISGNIYVTGDFQTAGYFGNVYLPTAGDYDIFIMRIIE